MERWQTLFEQVKPRSQAVERRRAQALEEPLPVDEAELAHLDSMPMGNIEGPKVRKPSWFRVITELRDELRQCGLRFTDEEGNASVYKLIFCKKSPPNRCIAFPSHVLRR
eukprot:2969387-Lingulodinium_polyedra.AAC.1